MTTGRRAYNKTLYKALTMFSQCRVKCQKDYNLFIFLTDLNVETFSHAMMAGRCDSTMKTITAFRSQPGPSAFFHALV
jgi:hypothetical protein